MNFIKKFILYELLLIVSLSTFVFGADIYLTLSAHGQRTDLGISGFVPENDKVEEAKLGRLVTEVLINDLLFSRYFNIVEGGPLYTGKNEELLDWQQRGANVLVCGKVSLRKNELVVTGQLFDIYSQKVIWEKTFYGSVDEFRYIAHDLNDEIIFRFTGEKGIAHTKIAFVNNGSKSKELYVMDYDGYNPRQLSSDRSINLFPKWSPDGKEIIFTTYRYGNPDLYAMAVPGGERRAVSKLQGLNTAGSFSPDGQSIALTLSRGNVPNIYIIKKDGSIIRQLTFLRGIATSPCFAPNGKEIVYISDIPGWPQVYIINLDTGRSRRIITRGFCDSPVWSPRGDRIIFTMRVRDYGYELFVYDLNTSEVSRLTYGKARQESPSFSPDGRFITYSSTINSKSEIYVMAVDGSGVRKLTDLPGSSTTPSWSP